MPPPAISTVMIRPCRCRRHDMGGSRGQPRKAIWLACLGWTAAARAANLYPSMRTNMLKLYYAAGTCALASHIALQEAGATYTTERLDFKSNQQNSREYLAINPKGRVPALVPAR